MERHAQQDFIARHAGRHQHRDGVVAVVAGQVAGRWVGWTVVQRRMEVGDFLGASADGGAQQLTLAVDGALGVKLRAELLHQQRVVMLVVERVHRVVGTGRECPQRSIPSK
jgi:hypothetical protein